MTILDLPDIYFYKPGSSFGTDSDLTMYRNLTGDTIYREARLIRYAYRSDMAAILYEEFIRLKIDVRECPGCHNFGLDGIGMVKCACGTKVIKSYMMTYGVCIPMLEPDKADLI